MKLWATGKFGKGLLALVMACWGCAGAETLLVGGTGSALESLRQLGVAFAKKEPGFQLQVLPSLGTSGAIKGLASRSIDLGAASRDLKDSEKSFGLQSFASAKTPVVIATSRQGETDISRVRVGQSAKITVAALGKQVTGKVLRIVPKASKVGGDVVFKVIIALDEQPEGLLWGMSTKVELTPN